MKKIALLITGCFFVAMNVIAQTNTNEKLLYRDSRVRDYLAPQSILWKSDETGEWIKNAEKLLIPGNGQADLSREKEVSFINNGSQNAAIIFDFGKEIHGGLQIVTGMLPNKPQVKVRIRFGESVAEVNSAVGVDSTATNDHAMRDFVLNLPWLGKLEVGNTGFRFVRIDLLGDSAKMLLREVNAISIYRDIPYLGSFKSNDELLNKIWQTGAYTVHLNMQEYLWDGIKRDRLVWVGDMHPEVMTINSVFGYNDVVPKSLDVIRDVTPVDQWMNGISSYSMWWILIHKEWFLNNGDTDYLMEQKAYMPRLLQKLCAMVDDKGREHLDGTRFLDWPSSPYPKAVDAGYHALLKMTLEAGADMCAILGEPETEEMCRKKAALMEKVHLGHENSKQAAALLSISNSILPEEGNSIIEKDGAQRFSTFYGYYMLQAMAKAENYTNAMNIIRQYWGGMLELGATTFWEDFDMDWLKNADRIDQMPTKGKIDVHSTYGGYCYEGFRHSFCHGWASGPTAWLSEHVLGIKVLEPGCKKVAIQPNLGDLEWVEGSYPTPYGLIQVSHKKLENGEIKSEVTVPEGVVLVE